jgi:hypothetical protein
MKTNWLSQFLKRLTFREKLDSKEAGSMLDPIVVRRVVRGIITTRADELDCDTCFEQVDRFAEMMLTGRDAAEALPLVQDHLNRCDDCREEFEALLEALRALR